MQLLPAPKFVVQLLASLKLLALMPDTAILEIFRDALPVLKSVTVLGALDVPDVTRPNITEDEEVSADLEELS